MGHCKMAERGRIKKILLVPKAVFNDVFYQGLQDQAGHGLVTGITLGTVKEYTQK